MTELAQRIQKEIDDGRSLRYIGRKADMSPNTVKRVMEGKEVDHATLEKLAQYLRVPKEEVYRMAGLLPSMYKEDGTLNRGWVVSELWRIIEALPPVAQAKLYAEAVALAEEYEKKTPVKQTAS